MHKKCKLQLEFDPVELPRHNPHLHRQMTSNMPSFLPVQAAGDFLHVAYYQFLLVPLRMLERIHLEQLTTSSAVIRVERGVRCDERDQPFVDH